MTDFMASSIEFMLGEIAKKNKKLIAEMAANGIGSEPFIRASLESGLTNHVGLYFLLKGDYERARARWMYSVPWWGLPEEELAVSWDRLEVAGIYRLYRKKSETFGFSYEREKDRVSVDVFLDERLREGIIEYFEDRGIDIRPSQRHAKLGRSGRTPQTSFEHFYTLMVQLTTLLELECVDFARECSMRLKHMAMKGKVPSEYLEMPSPQAISAATMGLDCMVTAREHGTGEHAKRAAWEAIYWLTKASFEMRGEREPFGDLFRTAVKLIAEFDLADNPEALLSNLMPIAMRASPSFHDKVMAMNIEVDMAKGLAAPAEVGRIWRQMKAEGTPLIGA